MVVFIIIHLVISRILQNVSLVSQCYGINGDKISGKGVDVHAFKPTQWNIVIFKAADKVSKVIGGTNPISVDNDNCKQAFGIAMMALPLAVILMLFGVFMSKSWHRMCVLLCLFAFNQLSEWSIFSTADLVLKGKYFDSYTNGKTVDLP